MRKVVVTRARAVAGIACVTHCYRRSDAPTENKCLRYIVEKAGGRTRSKLLSGPVCEYHDLMSAALKHSLDTETTNVRRQCVAVGFLADLLCLARSNCFGSKLVTNATSMPTAIGRRPVRGPLMSRLTRRSRRNRAKRASWGVAFFIARSRYGHVLICALSR